MDLSGDTGHAVAEDRPEATPGLLRQARVRNLLGLVTPVANLGMYLVSPRSLRSFGVGAGVALTAAGVWFLWRGRPAVGVPLLAAHFALVLAGLVDPRFPEIAGRAWIALGRGMGVVMGFVTLPLVYWLVVTPMALVARLFGARPLDPPRDDAESFWRRRKPPPPGGFKRQF